MQPNTIYRSDGSVKQVGVLSAETLRVFTATSEKVRCEIGIGDWEIDEAGHEEADIDRNQGVLSPA